jgi:hypothetical protein
MGAYITDIVPASTLRGDNKMVKTFTTDNKLRENFIPYNISFTLSMASLYMNETDQMLEQILPYFTPYVMTRVQVPEIDSHFDCKVILNGVSPDFEINMSDDEYRIVKWDLSFEVHSYLIKPVSDPSIINEIYLQFKDLDYYDPSTYPASGSAGLFETMHITGYKDESAEII